ncbi:MAG: nucleotide exchange factor GrpE [Weeksellaceae bacterium]
MNKENETFEGENMDKDQDINTNTESNNDNETANDTAESTLEKDYQDLKDRNLRLFAEFENYKKRTTKERLDLFKTANESLLIDLLPVLDDFERGIKQAKNDGDLGESAKGMELIYHKFLTILEAKGLKKMESAAGDDFDLDKHEAITQVDAPSEDLKGKIIDIVETGYSLNEKVIRYAKVIVGK